MRNDAPLLLPILRSRHQADLLTMLLLHPEHRYTVAELVRRLSIPQATVSKEVQRLAAAGIVTTEVVGRSRLIQPNTRSRLVPPLTELITLTYGPHVVVADEFVVLENVELVVIFGSWAARYHGQRGLPPNDIDVLVVGAPNRIAMYDAAQRAEARLGRPVNPTVCTPEQWAHPTEPFIQEIVSRPYEVVLDHRAGTDGSPT
jgi:DNA-binding transcriptional ArsR family regulator